MPTYYDYRRVILTQEQAQNLTIGLIISVFTAMALNITEPEVAFLIALSVLLLAEVLTFNETLAGFSNDGLITIGSLFIVIGAIEKAHIVDYGSRKAFGMSSSVFWGKFRMYVASFIVSAFFNNIPQVAIMVPVVKDWARLRKIPSSQLLIPLSYVVLAGGMLATVGTSTNLVIQGLLSNDNREQFGFFDPAAIGGPAGVILIGYMLVAGKYLLPNHEDKVSAEHTRGFTHVIEVQIHEGSYYTNKAVRYIFEGLGMTSDNLIKIRRHKSALSASESGKTVATIADVNAEGVELTVLDGTAAEVVKDVENASSEGGSVYATHRVPKHHTKKAHDAPISSPLKYLQSFITQFTVQAWDWIDERLPWFFGLPEGFEKVQEKYEPHTDLFEDLQPDPETILLPGDTLFVANGASALGKVMKTMPWENHGITVYGGTSIMELPSYGYKLVEVTISNSNQFINRRVADVAHDISAKYEACIISAKSLDDCEDNIEKLFSRCGTGAQVLQQGSALLLVTSTSSYDKMLLNREFISVNIAQKLDKPATAWSFCPLIVFLCIVSLVAGEQLEMMPAALSMAAFFFVGGWLVPSDIDKYVDLRLLMLMGTSLSFATAMTKTGLAQKIANEISSGIESPVGLMFLIYLSTLFITEIISNNAAAALMYPIAVKLADNLGYSYKPFAMVVMQAASMAFMCPIGYPTHVMVWRPGNYQFMDFVKFGLCPNLIWCVVSCLLCPLVWPLK